MRTVPFAGTVAYAESGKLVLLLILSLAWLLPGLFGHGPWKPDEAAVFGIVYSMLETRQWLVPMLAGEPELTHGPLYYWTAAAFAHLFQWGLPLHDGARLASGFYMALTLAAVGLAARELYGPTTSRLAIALLIGCVGLLVHAHEMITDTALLGGYALALVGFALVRRKVRLAGVMLGVGLGVAFLARGIVPALGVIACAVLLLAFPAWRTRAHARAWGLAVLASAPFVWLWPAWLYFHAPELFQRWWALESLPRVTALAANFARNEFAYFFNALPWFAFPVLPIALWSLWGYRHKLLREPGFQLPIVFFVVTMTLIGLAARMRDIHALPVLLPLTLLAVPGADHLRRGAANALGWFGIMTFGLAAVFMWFAYLTTQLGLPERFYRHILKLQPGYVPSFEWLPFLVALVLTVLWLLPLRQSFRSGRRAVFHWAAGITLIWGLASTLWLPWIDHGKSYAGVVAELRKALPPNYRCIGSAGLGEPQRGLLHYYGGVLTTRAEVAEFDAYGCDVFLLQTNPRKPDARPGAGWEEFWRGSRPGDRNEAFLLFRPRVEAP